MNCAVALASYRPDRPQQGKSAEDARLSSMQSHALDTPPRCLSMAVGRRWKAGYRNGGGCRPGNSETSALFMRVHVAHTCFNSLGMMGN